MASELKPWKYDIQYGPEGEANYAWVYDDKGIMVATVKTHKAKQIVDAMNTRPAPAATDTGLETIGYGSPGSLQMIMDGQMDHASVTSTSGGVFTEPVCFRSQAEELLAAERARADANFNKVIEQAKRAEKAETDNAVKDARIKYLEDAIKAKGGNEHSPTQDAYDLACKAIEKHRNRAEALEAKLAAAEKALEPFAEYCGDHFDKDYDGNPLPDEQKVGWVYLNYGHFRKARAVLGGEPS